MSAFTEAQRRELVDAAARSRLEYTQQREAKAKEWQAERKAARAEARAANPPKQRKRKPPLPAKSEPMWTPTQAEEALADRLMVHIATDSTIDRRRHALGVARLILQGRRK